MNRPLRPVLGRGLSALIPGADAPSAAPSVPLTLALDQIQPARVQPRVQFDEARIAELAASIEANGILQPIVVRAIGGGQYRIIAGERRYRAARRVGLAEVPIVLREATDAVAFELALVENIQREDLDPIEEAEAYQHLISVHELTQQQVAKRVGKDRVTVANALRLLRLSPELRSEIASGALSAGHGRALLMVEEDSVRAELAREAIAQGWSVRETERQARALRESAPSSVVDPEAERGSSGPERASPGPDSGSGQESGSGSESDPDPLPPRADRNPADEAIERQIRAAIGAPVTLHRRDGRGRLEIRFHSLAELERLVDLFASLEGA